MPTRYGESPWIAEFPKARRPAFPRLRGEHTCDVVIVGGGLTGCATAYACAMAGLETMAAFKRVVQNLGLFSVLLLGVASLFTWLSRDRTRAAQG